MVFAFIVSYATITSGNGDIPKSGSFEMAMRIVNKYKEYGGVLNTNSAVEKIVLNGKMAEGILLQDGKKINADYIVCSCNIDYTFQKLLPNEYMPKSLKKQYKEREKYPVISGF